MRNYCYELEARHDSRASFYGKAQVRQEGERLILRSYQTDVAYTEDGRAVVLGQWSATTSRHVKEFLLQEGFKAENTRQILKDYKAPDTMTEAERVKKEGRY